MSQVGYAELVVFATNALSMGVNFKEIRYVVRYGPPRCIENFVRRLVVLVVMERRLFQPSFSKGNTSRSATKASKHM